MPPKVSPAERELQRLRTLPENRICPNCGKKDTTFGFQAVCMAFKTFVCSDCKSAHQAYSHRCKSTSMSVWNMEEVQSLDERHGGGNRACRENWLANVPESSWPRPDSHVDAKKSFVEKAYIKKEWVRTGDSAPDRHGAASSSQASAAVAPSPTPRAQQQSSRSTGRGQKAPEAAASPPGASSTGGADMLNLLDDLPAAAPAASTAKPDGGGMAGSLLDNFLFSDADCKSSVQSAQAVTAPSAASAPAAQSLLTMDSFDPFSAPQGSAPPAAVSPQPLGGSPSAFDFLNTATSPTSPQAPAAGYGGVAGASSTSSLPTPVQAAAPSSSAFAFLNAGSPSSSAAASATSAPPMMAQMQQQSSGMYSGRSFGGQQLGPMAMPGLMSGQQSYGYQAGFQGAMAPNAAFGGMWGGAGATAFPSAVPMQQQQQQPHQQLLQQTQQQSCSFSFVNGAAPAPTKPESADVVSLFDPLAAAA
mmetsp:Transcript_129418/g.224097  ORF Transcript_129418/g.224097 Transcript_129418/m.224097 type:complete len:474 (+) Transcript_129418:81-1502(+)